MKTSKELIDFILNNVDLKNQLTEYKDILTSRYPSTVVDEIIIPNVEYIKAMELKDTEMVMYHEYFGQVKCKATFENNHFRMKKIGINSGTAKHHTLMGGYLYYDKEMTQEFELRSGTIRENIKEYIHDQNRVDYNKLCQEKAEAIYIKIKEMLKEKFPEIFYSFQSGHGTVLVFRGMYRSIRTSELSITYSHPASCNRTVRVFNLIEAEK